MLAVWVENDFSKNTKFLLTNKRLDSCLSEFDFQAEVEAVAAEACQIVVDGALRFGLDQGFGRFRVS